MARPMRARPKVALWGVEGLVQPCPACHSINAEVHNQRCSATGERSYRTKMALDEARQAVPAEVARVASNG